MKRNLLKSKRSNSRADFESRKGIMLKSTRSQEAFGMSFGMIFSIILIIFFLVAAFIAIRYFLDWQKEVQLRTFFANFQNDINDAWANAGIVGHEQNKSYVLPSSINAVCFIDFSSSSYSGSNAAKCTSIQRNFGTKNANFAVYPNQEKYDKIIKRAGYKLIDNIKKDGLPNGDCYCFLVANGRVNIKFKTSTENNLVKIE